MQTSYFRGGLTSLESRFLKTFDLSDKSQWIGKIITQKAKTSKVNKVRCSLLQTLASIYILESFTWIPIQILYVHGHFNNVKDYTIWDHPYYILMIKLSHWAWVACGWIDHFTVVVTRIPQTQICHLHSKYMIGVLQLQIVNKRRKKTEENSR